MAASIFKYQSSPTYRIEPGASSRACGKRDPDLAPLRRCESPAHPAALLPGENQFVFLFCTQLSPVIRRMQAVDNERVAPHDSKKKIALRHGQDLRGLAREQHAVRAHFVRVRIDFDARQGVVVDHVPLGQAAAVIHGDRAFLQAELLARVPRSSPLSTRT